MITYNNSGLDHLLNGMCDKFDILPMNNISIFPTDEDRGLDLCCVKQLVLADATGIDYQNDYNSFLFQLAISTDTLVMYLQKDNVTIATLNTSTYGTYYALASIVYYSDQSLLTGYILEWSKVLAAHGEGNYRVKVDYTSLGVTVNYYSNNFDLKTSYLLVLFALLYAPLAYVAPTREVSMMLALFIGAKALHEKVTPLKTAGVLAMMTGVILISLAR